MISRIKKIQQVGVFRDFTSGGPVEFNPRQEKLTIIYGNNRGGKTTLVSILRALNQNSSEFIKKRQSMPKQTPSCKQHINLSYKDNQDAEKTIKFNHARGWENNSLENKIVIFDESFVHDNVMLGGAITEKNQENIINLILGEKAVKSYEAIRSKIHSALLCLGEICRETRYILRKGIEETRRFEYLHQNFGEGVIDCLWRELRRLKYLLEFLKSEEEDMDQNRHFLRSLRRITRRQTSLFDAGEIYEEDFESMQKEINNNLLECNTENMDHIALEEFKSLRNDIQIKMDEVGKVIRELEKNQAEIIDQQSKYLKKYRKSLNQWLDRFGSSEFRVQVTNKTMGSRQTRYQLQVEYEGVIVDNTDLLSIFSESDKRNLALALFMAIIEGEKNKIIVFDDPVVSIDDNSITNICMTLKEESQKHRQVIIVTHYKSLIEKMYDIKSLPATYLEIVKEGGSSKIQLMDVRSFCRSPLEKRYDKIAEFINDQGQPDRLILRQFLEESLKARFRHQLKEAGKHDKNLDTIVKELESLGCINKELAKEINVFKDSLNSEHHTIKDDNSEDIKSTAKALLKLIYEQI